MNQSKNDLKYCVSDTFNGAMLAPIAKNLLDKAEHDWDDYDEVYHCCQLVEAVRQNDKMKMDVYTAARNGYIVGVGLVTGGMLDSSLFFPRDFHPAEPAGEFFVFNYFHVAPEERGIGSHWLKKIILPNCDSKGYSALYVKSSHPKVFSLYGRLGDVVGEYKALSDNGLRERQGKIFRIVLKK